MTVLAIKRDWGPTSAVSVVRMVTNSSIQDVIGTNWLEIPAIAQSIIEVNNGPFQWADSDFVIVHFVDPITGKFLPTGGLFSIFPANDQGVFTSLNPLPNIYPNLQGIVAHAGGGQADATQLNIGINNVTVVASPNDSVKLPTDVLGQTVLVTNLGASDLWVYPAVGDSILGFLNTQLVMAPTYPSNFAVFYGITTTNWFYLRGNT